MKHLSLAAWLIFTAVASAADPSIPLPFTEVKRLFVTTSPSTIYRNNAVFMVTHNPGWNAGPQTADTWVPVDFKPFGVSREAFSVFLRGLMVITHGVLDESAHIEVAFAAPGSVLPPCNLSDPVHSLYIAQAVAVEGGQRSGAATWAPVVDGVTLMCYHVDTNGDYPAHSAYAINLSIQAYVE